MPRRLGVVLKIKSVTCVNESGEKAHEQEDLCAVELIAAFSLCVWPRPVAAQDPAELVSGAEFAAGANLTGKNVKVDGTIFVPDAARRVSAVIVLVGSWPGADRGVYDSGGRKLSAAEAARRPDPRGENLDGDPWRWGGSATRHGGDCRRLANAPFFI